MLLFISLLLTLGVLMVAMQRLLTDNCLVDKAAYCAIACSNFLSDTKLIH